jgi:MerR HTH family regulatory protein
VQVDDEMLRRLARSSGLTRAEVRHVLEFHVVTLPGGVVQPALLRRLRKAHRLRRDLGFSMDAVVIILRLIDRLETLEGKRASSVTVTVVDHERYRA